MKTLNKLLIIAGACLLIVGCETNLDNKFLADESEYVSPAIISPSAINISTEDLASDALVTFTWSPADFGLPASVAYSINAKYNGKSTSLYSNITQSSYEAKSSELADKLVNLGVEKGKKADVKLNITATIGSNFTVLTSNTATISIFIEQ